MDKMYCVNHPNTHAIAKCSHCGKPICEKCCQVTVAMDDDFCSKRCANAHQRHSKKHDTVSPDLGASIKSDEELVEGMEHPFATGMKLWRQSILLIMTRIGLPLAAAVYTAVLFFQKNQNFTSQGELIILFVLGLIFAYVIISIKLVLLKQYAGILVKDITVMAATRLFPTIITWVLTGIVIAIGYILLIIPGIVLSLRLFWADEFALSHGQHPVKAMGSSFKLTEGYSWSIFSFLFFEGVLTNIVGTCLIFILLPLVESVRNVLPEQAFVAFVVCVSSISIVMVYAFFHASQVVYFYGLRAQKVIDEKMMSDKAYQAKRVKMEEEVEKIHSNSEAIKKDIESKLDTGLGW